MLNSETQCFVVRYLVICQTFEQYHFAKLITVNVNQFLQQPNYAME